MAISQRYRPSHAPGSSAMYAVDFSNILPPGVGVSMPSVQFNTNTVPPGIATGITSSGGGFRGRMVWINISGGIAGTDYLVTWTVIDTTGNTWIITALLLCAATS